MRADRVEIVVDSGKRVLAASASLPTPLLLALRWSVVLSPIALVVTALLAVVLELKARYEESMLAERYPEYEAYRRRVRWRFVPGVR